MNKIVTTHVFYRGSLILVEFLKDQSQIEVEVECPHGRRFTRWCRRNQLCKQCAVSAGMFNTSPKGRKITWGNKISKAKKGVKATDAHKRALSIAQYGVTEQEWDGFYEKSEVAKIRDSIEYKEFRSQVMQRDDYRCCLTGRKGHLEVHHIIGVSTDPSRILDQNNAVTLHAAVHKAFHSHFGKSKNTLEQFNEFKELLLKNELEC